MQLYDRHSITAKGVDETVNWNMKDPLFFAERAVLVTSSCPQQPLKQLILEISSRIAGARHLIFQIAH